MRVLVTGGAGFIGSHTVDLLLASGMDVIVYDNFQSGRRENLNLSHPRLQLMEEDILNHAKLVTALQNCQAVLHLAALPSVPRSIQDPLQSLRVNTQGFVHVLQAIRELARPIRLVYASSAAVYGATASLPCCDESPLPLEPLSPYALEKANNERYADLYDRLFGIKSLGLRYFNVYGPRQDPASPYSGVISKFIACYKQQQPITIFGDGEQSRDFIQVKDVARANLLALQSEVSGVMNVATGKPETLCDLVCYMENKGGKQAVVEYMAPRTGDIVKSYAKIEKANRQLGFHSEISLANGIQSLLE